MESAQNLQWSSHVASSYCMSVSISLEVSCLSYCSVIRHGTKGRASKAFITQDKAGASFLCYLLGQLNKLR